MKRLSIRWRLTLWYGVVLSAIPLDAKSGAATIGAALNLLQEALQEIPRQNGNASIFH